MCAPACVCPSFPFPSHLLLASLPVMRRQARLDHNSSSPSDVLLSNYRVSIRQREWSKGLLSQLAEIVAGHSRWVLGGGHLPPATKCL